uniref:Uncharacterized protein n=1 Tax=Chromera velia CCMP2878 TaxID=1169474 RepID=A0A0G4I768_9ALVE|mmetsp:Transcript_33784/g.66886  ORF Transcript_33784/g.66886 Transcript_33784/m.66886 type:complete len:84 (-) Transcript_33784:1551-1802(-)|eukprot:Cvel_11614.t1-p1 / transcript=Cvel_11614.t1 / gene=Cvel_11614 / organism=Chromera_velia_CCMP2878 / gene_product=hypothetical protein / transcript_product=hypothetical protein / location=Cvel_scaffold735:53752-54000(+) / protein_length=83 / sequence_SO=supercontig / SO=protein_coding / is_pseudo=false
MKGTAPHPPSRIPEGMLQGSELADVRETLQELIMLTEHALRLNKSEELSFSEFFEATMKARMCAGQFYREVEDKGSSVSEQLL